MLPNTPAELLSWEWPQIEPFFDRLAAQTLDGANVDEWLRQWSELAARLDEMYSRLYVATTVNTADEQSQQRYDRFLDEIYPRGMAAQQKLKEKLLASGLAPKGFELGLRDLRSEADLFCEQNLTLLAEEQKLNGEYDRITGAQTVTWEGEECTLARLLPLYQSTDRELRERAWRAVADRQLADREAINELWQRLLALRQQIARNAGKPDYRAYMWQQYKRFDYTPADCRSFHDAIEQVVVPAASRIYERRRQRLGLERLCPWDLDVDTSGQPALQPFKSVDELKRKTSAIFHRVDPQLGAYFDTLNAEGLLDLENRKNKANGGYCLNFAASRRPFIFMNAVGQHDDVDTLLHEGGHCFHAFEAAHLLFQQQQVPSEFAEVASMSMELIAAPYLTAAQGGFYTPAEAARARREHLEKMILFWPYMAVVDAFQHWVYENPQSAADPAQCDACWQSLQRRFMPGIHWDGLEEVEMTGWHRKLHIHTLPFYYVEYGLAMLGAVQVWRNALQDQAAAVASYRKALALGTTVPLPELFRAAGGRLAFDAASLGEAVALIESTLGELEAL